MLWSIRGNTNSPTGNGVPSPLLSDGSPTKVFKSRNNASSLSPFSVWRRNCLVSLQDVLVHGFLFVVEVTEEELNGTNRLHIQFENGNIYCNFCLWNGPLNTSGFSGSSVCSTNKPSPHWITTNTRLPGEKTSQMRTNLVKAFRYRNRNKQHYIFLKESKQHFPSSCLELFY